MSVRASVKSHVSVLNVKASLLTQMSVSEQLLLMKIFVLFPTGDANRQISDLKFRLVKSEQEVTTLEQNVSVNTDNFSLLYLQIQSHIISVRRLFGFCSISHNVIYFD